MVSNKDVIALLKAGLSVEVWDSVVPEAEALPAVAVSNVANPSSRTLAGTKTKNMHVYRVSVVAYKQSDLEATMKELEDMDNSSDNNFKNVFTQWVNTEAKLPDEPVRRAFYDLTLYPR